MRICRTQPPAGYRVPTWRIARAVAGRLASSGAKEAFEEQAARHFGVRSAVAVSSGKAALATTLQALHAITGRTRVVVPAYTCYSVPSAIVKAGLVPVPCDIAPGTFDYDYGRLQAMLGRDILCALSVHLFGIPADTRRLKELCEPHDILVVEDAAQAMGVEAGGAMLGTRGEVGFFSLGRGKNLTCGSGGLILTNRIDVAERIRSAVGRQGEGLGKDLQVLAELCATSMFISPWLYWFPAGIPSLRLGETFFHPDFPIHPLSELQARVLDGWPEWLAALNRVRRETGALYRRELAAVCDRQDDIPYLRFPVMMTQEGARERVLREGSALGIGVMYPASVGAIPQIRGVLPDHRFPEAERVASSLVTLPTHPLLTDRDRRRICDVVNASAANPLRAVDHQGVAVKAR